MRQFCTLIVLFLCIVSASKAEDTRLKSLNSINDTQAWEAVGRLNIGNDSFCTGALVSPDLVLTAAHCLYDAKTHKKLGFDNIEFQAGLRHGRASAYRKIRQAVVHPEYVSSEQKTVAQISNDLALLQLDVPIRNKNIVPFQVDTPLIIGGDVTVVSYAKDRTDAPSLQESCTVLSQEGGILITSCAVNFGASGAPVFALVNGKIQIISVIAAMSSMNGKPVAIGMALDAPLARLRAQMGLDEHSNSKQGRKNGLGAKFLKATNP